MWSRTNAAKVTTIVVPANRAFRQRSVTGYAGLSGVSGPNVRIEFLLRFLAPIWPGFLFFEYLTFLLPPTLLCNLFALVASGIFNQMLHRAKRPQLADYSILGWHFLATE